MMSRIITLCTRIWTFGMSCKCMLLGKLTGSCEISSDHCRFFLDPQSHFYSGDRDSLLPTVCFLVSSLLNVFGIPQASPVHFVFFTMETFWLADPQLFTCSFFSGWSSHSSRWQEIIRWIHFTGWKLPSASCRPGLFFSILFQAAWNHPSHPKDCLQTFEPASDGVPQAVLESQFFAWSLYSFPSNPFGVFFAHGTWIWLFRQVGVYRSGVDFCCEVLFPLCDQGWQLKNTMQQISPSPWLFRTGCRIAAASHRWPVFSFFLRNTTRRKEGSWSTGTCADAGEKSCQGKSPNPQFSLWVRIILNFQSGSRINLSHVDPSAQWPPSVCQ